MSTVIFPLRKQASAEAGGPRSSGVLLPLRFGGAASSATQRDLEVMKAVAAAVAVTHTGPSLQIAREIQKGDENPGDVFDRVVAAAADLDVVVSEVRRVQKDRSGAAGPDEEQRIVAAAVGADPVLVAAAAAKLKEKPADDPVAKAAREWVAAADADLLERAARAGARREFLNPGPAKDDIKKVQEDVKKVQDDMKKVGERLDKIETRLPDLFDSIGRRLDSIDKRLSSIKKAK